MTASGREIVAALYKPEVDGEDVLLKGTTSICQICVDKKIKKPHQFKNKGSGIPIRRPM